MNQEVIISGRDETPIITKTCSICGEPLESRICGRIYAHRCKCDRKATAEVQAERLRKKGISASLYRKMRFENDRGYHPRASERARKYVENFPKILEENIGLLFYGDVGTGKTFYAGCIANALIDNGYFAVMINPGGLTKLNPDRDEDNELYRLMNEADLIVFDDLGAERDTPTATERVFSFVNERINADKPIIITTNKNPEEMTGEGIPLAQKRIYDRIRGVTIPIYVSGDSAREKQNADKFDLLKEILKES